MKRTYVKCTIHFDGEKYIASVVTAVDDDEEEEEWLAGCLVVQFNNVTDFIFEMKSKNICAKKQRL